MNGYDKAKETADVLAHRKEEEMKKSANEIVEIKKDMIAKKEARGLNIAGLEDESASIIPLPYVRVVQPTSQDTTLSDGKDAPMGTFLFNDTKTPYETIEFCILKSKVVKSEFERDKEVVHITQRKILAITLDTKKVFILSLSVMSFSNYGRLVAQMKENKMAATWERSVKAKTVKTENEKGKFYVVDFELGSLLSGEQVAELAQNYEEYKSVLEKREEETGMPF